MYRPFATARNCAESDSADNCHNRARPNGSGSRSQAPGQCRRPGGWRSRRPLLEGLSDLRKQFVAHHVVADVHGAGEAFSVRRAMAFDDDAIEAEEYPAVGLAWIHLVL